VAGQKQPAIASEEQCRFEGANEFGCLLVHRGSSRWMAGTLFPECRALVSCLSSASVRNEESRDEGCSNLGGLGVSA
jgi:hypothetical protein